jgi:hypothetical protein
MKKNVATILGYIGIVFNFCYSYACVHLPCKNSKKYSICEDFVFALIISFVKLRYRLKRQGK